jgi:hypothetical protein
VTEFRQLKIQVRTLAARLAALEAAQAARPARRKRERAPRPTDAIITARRRLWAQYVLVHVAHRGRVTYLSFAVKHRLNPSEFARWFSMSDARGIPPGSGPDRRFYQALTGAIAELEGRAHGSYLHGGDNSRGNIAGSQFSGSAPQ